MHKHRVPGIKRSKRGAEFVNAPELLWRTCWLGREVDTNLRQTGQSENWKQSRCCLLSIGGFGCY